MASLRSVLVKNVGEPDRPNISLGADDEVPAPPKAPALDKDKLQRDLAVVYKDNNRYFIVCVVMVCALFVASVGVVMMNLNSPDVIKVTMAAFGISSAGLITMMIKLWREKSNTELLLALASNMGTGTLETVVKVLINKV